MKAPHKYSDASISVHTKLSPDRIAELTMRVGRDMVSPSSLADLTPTRVAVESIEPPRIRFSVQGLHQTSPNSPLRFSVWIHPTPTGASLESRIDEYKTVQVKYKHVVPVTTKKMRCYPTYRLFMESLGYAVRQEDPSAEVVITESHHRPKAVALPPQMVNRPGSNPLEANGIDTKPSADNIGGDVAWRFNTPPGWPTPPQGWRPHRGWLPDPSWPPAPHGWQFWVLQDPTAAG